MDQMEVTNLVLIKAHRTGEIWQKDGPCAGKEKATAAVSTVGQSEVRQFGNTAILTGLVRTKNGNKSDQASETVVWIRMNKQMARFVGTVDRGCTEEQLNSFSEEMEAYARLSWVTSAHSV